MSLLLLLGSGGDPPVIPESSWGLQFVLFAADHGERWPVFPIDGTIGHDKTMVGQASLTFPMDDDAVTLFMGATLGQEFPEVVCRCYCRGTLIWTGVAITARLATRGAAGVVEVTFEHVYGHFLRRRQIFASALAVVDSGTDQADDAILIIQKNQIGLTPVVPTGHPGTRTDMGSFTVTVDTGSSLAASTRIAEQSGNNLLDVSIDAIEANDLAPVLTDQQTGAFVLGMTYPFQDTDLSDLVIFNQYHGNLASFEFVSDRSQLANVVAIEGKTAKTAEWDSDAPSITLWGEYELFGQKPQDTEDVTAKSDEAAKLLARQSSAKLTYKAEIIETDGHLFVTDWFWRDKVRIYESTFGLNVTGAVTAWTMRVSNSRMYQLDIILGEPRAGDIFRDIIGRTGLDGVRFLGGKYRNRRQA